MPVGSREHHDDRTADETDGTTRAGSDVATVARPVVVRRSAGVAALVGYGASAVAIAYLWRASQTTTVLDWALFAVMAVIAGVYLSALVDARTPLLVADDLGVRIRLGHEWRGLPWEAIGQVVVHPRRGPLRDGRLVIAPRSLARAVDGLDVKARRHVTMNQKMYGAPLAVPLGTTTRISSSDPRGSGEPTDRPAGSTADALAREAEVAAEIAALALGRADVVVLDPVTLEVVGEAGSPKESHERLPGGPERRSLPETAPTPGNDGRTPEGREAAVDGETMPAADVPTVFPAPPGSAPTTKQVVFPAPGVGDVDGPRRPSTAWLVEPGPASDDQGTPRTTGREADNRPLQERFAWGAPRRSILGGIGTIVSRVAKGRLHDVDRPSARQPTPTEPLPAASSTEAAQVPSADAPAGFGPTGKATPGGARTAPADREQGAEVEDGADTDGVTGNTSKTSAAGVSSDPAHVEGAGSPTRRASALRQTRPATRAEATLEVPPTAGKAALDVSSTTSGESGSGPGRPDGRELRRPGSVDLVFERVEVDDRIRPISTLGDPVEPLVIDDYVTEPAYDPVIGPELAAARTRLGLSVDDLAERTRIRPHVIESIEVDDFAPCGGDFYARGHLRTLARILGKDVEPMMQKFEERYATAPINARRVFEAELATGMRGSMRSTIGGPSWGLLVGVVLCIVLIWGVLRLFTTQPADVQPPLIHGSAAFVGGPPAPDLTGQL